MRQKIRRKAAWPFLLASLTMSDAFGLQEFSGLHDAPPKVARSEPGTHGFPFLSTTLDLSAYGYLEEEFLLTGTARAFAFSDEPGNDGRWNAIPNPGVSAPYTVRLIVRRPVHPGNFNGSVMVEWLNVTGGQDVHAEWAYNYPALLNEGYAYVGVTAQLVGARVLQDWESGPTDRYADIFHPGDSFSYDIFSQSGVAIVRPEASGPKPLGPLTPNIHSMIAAGESQSAMRMFTYYNAIHPLVSVFDAFLIHSYLADPSALSQSSGGGVFLDSFAPPAGVVRTPDISVPAGREAHLRDDIDTPVILLLTETDLVFPNPLTILGVHSQPDNDYLRVWEVTGAAHADSYVMRTVARDSIKSGGADAGFDCESPPVNDGGPHIYAVRGALHALHVWLTHGKQPGHSPRIETLPGLIFPSIVRDDTTGIARGGLRMPQVSVPTATYSGMRPLASLFDNVLCSMFGATDLWNEDSDAYDGGFLTDPSPSPEPALKTLYEDRNSYLLQFGAAVDAAVLEGYIRPGDVGELLQNAKQTAFP